MSVPLRDPRSLAERRALAVLDREGVVPFATLVQCVASDLYLDALRQGGWMVDIGVLGPPLFVNDAARAIEAADGALWTIKSEGDRNAGHAPLAAG
jgi:hypothetical protein